MGGHLAVILVGPQSEFLGVRYSVLIIKELSHFNSNETKLFYLWHYWCSKLAPVGEGGCKITFIKVGLAADENCVQFSFLGGGICGGHPNWRKDYLQTDIQTDHVMSWQPDLKRTWEQWMISFIVWSVQVSLATALRVWLARYHGLDC